MDDTSSVCVKSYQVDSGIGLALLRPLVSTTGGENQSLAVEHSLVKCWACCCSSKVLPYF